MQRATVAAWNTYREWSRGKSSEQVERSGRAAARAVVVRNSLFLGEIGVSAFFLQNELRPPCDGSESRILCIFQPFILQGRSGVASPRRGDFPKPQERLYGVIIGVVGIRVGDQDPTIRGEEDGAALHRERAARNSVENLSGHKDYDAPKIDPGKKPTASIFLSGDKDRQSPTS